MVWPGKFNPGLLPRYDGGADPTEFLLHYAINVQAAWGDDRVMASCFPMVLKDAARTWFLNLLVASIPSWGDLCEQFVANFTDTGDCPLATDDLRAMRQHPGESLCRFIQCFNQACSRVPKVSDAAAVSAFADGVTDMRMCEELSIRGELDPAAELFLLADHRARAGEGCFCLRTEPGTARPKKDDKHEGPAALVEGPVYKRSHVRGSPRKDGHPSYTYRSVNSHSLEDGREPGLLHAGRARHRGGHGKRDKGSGGGSGSGRSGNNSNNRQG